jgi:hypothetical protein
MSTARMTVNEKLRIIWKEAVKAYFKVPFCHSFGETNTNHKKI